MAGAAQSELSYPFPRPPGLGEVVCVAPDILWARFPLPYRLNHVNIWLIRDTDGWAVFDAGIATEDCRAAWELLMVGPLAGERLTKLIVSHSHPDHIGLAGWLSARYGCALYTTQTAWLTCLYDSIAPDALNARPYREDYLRNGLTAEYADAVVEMGHGYLRMVDPLPPVFNRLMAGDRLQIGTRSFEVLTGEGHAPEQLMLWSEADGIFLAADQVIAGISPNVSVWATDPEGDPLGRYLKSLSALKAALPENALVLAGHQLPFYGLHHRIDALQQHHEERCTRILTAVAAGPLTIFELLPVLFRLPLDHHEMTFAFSEARAHVNRLLLSGRLVRTADGTRVQLPG